MASYSRTDIIYPVSYTHLKYVQQLASKYNTFGRKRSFKTSSGDTIEIGGGDYGWVAVSYTHLDVYKRQPMY